MSTPPEQSPGVLPQHPTRGGQTKPIYFLGKFLAGEISDAEAEAKGIELDIDMSDRFRLGAIKLLLKTYGKNKKAEVKEARTIAKEMDLGDIGRALDAWRKENDPSFIRRVVGMFTRRRKGGRTAKKSRRTYK